jgi:hypothetical protein
MQKKTKSNNFWIKLYVFYLDKKRIWFDEPYNSYIEKKAKNKLRKETISQFKSKYGLNYDKVSSLMTKIVNRPVNHYEHINEQLLEHRRLMQSQTFSYTPKFYEPEINEIHNENLNPNAPSLEVLMLKEKLNGYTQLQNQERDLGYHPRSCYAPSPSSKDVAVKAAKVESFNDLETKINNILKLEHELSYMSKFIPIIGVAGTKNEIKPIKKSWYILIRDFFKNKS